MNSLFNAVRVIKPMKVGFLVNSKKVIIIGYNSKIFNDTHIIKTMDVLNKEDGYLEFYLKDLENIFMKNNILDFNLDVQGGIINFITNNSSIEVESLGSEAREKKEILDIYMSDINKYHSLQINNINLEQIFKEFLLKNKESVETQDMGFFFSKLNKNNYFISIQKKIIQLLKNRSNYDFNGDISNVNTYKIPSIVRKMIALHSTNTLYISEVKDHVLYIDNNETYIIAPKKGFKYFDDTDNRKNKMNLIKDFMNLKRKVVLNITDKSEFLEFLEFSKEDFFIYLHGNNIRSKKSIHGNYYKANDVFKIIENDYNKDEEIMFSLKINTIKSVLENNTINYITFDLNSSLVALSSDADLSNTYNMYIFKLSNYN